MSKEMREQINKIKNFFTENSKNKLNISDVRQRCLNSFEDVVGRIPDENEIFMNVCNLYDYLDVTNNISREFGVRIDTDEYDEYDFNTVKDYIDWCVNNVV